MVLSCVNGEDGPCHRDARRDIARGKGEWDSTGVTTEERQKYKDFSRCAGSICARVETEGFKAGNIDEHDKPSFDQREGILDEYWVEP